MLVDTKHGEKLVPQFELAPSWATAGAVVFWMQSVTSAPAITVNTILV